MQFKYLGETYEIPRKSFDFCVSRNLLRKLFSEAIPKNPTDQTRVAFFILSTEDPEFRWFCAYSKNKKYYKRFNNTTKHKVIQNLTIQQCKYLDKLTKKCCTFQEAIKLSKEAVESIYEIS